MIRRTRSLLLCSVALFTAAVFTSCTGELNPATHLDSVAQLPLWQKLVAVGLATLISEDLACIAAGMLASEGVLSFGGALAGAFLGIYLGDIPLYLMGRIGGIALLRRRPFRWFIKEHQILQAESLFKEHGGKLIFSSRLLPGSRVPVYAAAGVLRYPFWKFALYMFIAGGLSALILVWGSMRLGEVVFEWLKIYESYVLPIFITLLVLVWLAVKLLEIFATKRSRLVFLARCRKIQHRLRRKPARS